MDDLIKTLPNTGWLHDEQRRYRTIAEEKLSGFNSSVADNKLWLSQYIRQVLDGGVKMDVASLMQTPAKRHQQLHLEVEASQKHVPTVPALKLTTGVVGNGPSELSKYMEQVREKIEQAAVKPKSSYKPHSISSNVDKSSKRSIEPTDVAANIPVTTSPKRMRISNDAALPPIPETPIVPMKDGLNAQEQRLKNIFAAGTDRLRAALGNLQPAKKIVAAQLSPIAVKEPGIKPQSKSNETSRIDLSRSHQSATRTSSILEQIGIIIKSPIMNRSNFESNSSHDETSFIVMDSAGNSDENMIDDTSFMQDASFMADFVDANPFHIVTKAPVKKLSPIKEIPVERATTLPVIRLSPKFPVLEPLPKVMPAILKVPVAAMKLLKQQHHHNMSIPSSPNPTDTIAGKQGSGDYFLPEVPSDDEDSDSDSTAHIPPFVPLWAQSPALRTSLLTQTQTNPDVVFGRMQTLKMEDIFKGSSMKRFRNRSSSANWTRDKLTQKEMEAYINRMGFQLTQEKTD